MARRLTRLDLTGRFLQVCPPVCARHFPTFWNSQWRSFASTFTFDPSDKRGLPGENQASDRPGGPTVFPTGVQKDPFGSEAFVSKHYQELDRDEIISFLKRKSLDFKQSGDQITIRECPFCHDIKGEESNRWTLGIKASSGAHNCFRCQAQGSWYEFKKRCSHGKYEIENMSVYSLGAKKDVAQDTETEFSKFPSNLGKFPAVLDYLLNRGLKPEILELYGVGATSAEFPYSMNPDLWVPQECVTLPWYDARTALGKTPKVVKVKLRSISTKRNMRLYPKGGRYGFFGWNTIPKGTESIIITEGEYDAMAVRQATGLPAISLTNGASSLPPELVECLEVFKEIVLWMDWDEPGSIAAEKFSKKLGIHRCRVVRRPNDDDLEQPSFKDANEALNLNADLAKLVEGAEILPHDQIATFADFREEVLFEVANAHLFKGMPTKSFPTLNEYIKGLRRGELTVMTGATGVGKTTFLSQLSLDYCSSGINTLWGSFEIKNVKLMQTMLAQLSQANLRQNIQMFNYWADEFEKLPMYFLKYHGSSELHDVLDSMDYACYVYDVQHVVLDNLQFMLSGQGTRFNDRFAIQDVAIKAFRDFASKRNIHITLVIHPRKERKEDQLDINSIYGSGKSTQEADNVLVLQGKGTAEQPHERRLHVLKNRYDGKIGESKLIFDPSSLRLVDRQAAGVSLRMEDDKMPPNAGGESPATGSNSTGGASGYDQGDILGADNLPDQKLRLAAELGQRSVETLVAGNCTTSAEEEVEVSKVANKSKTNTIQTVSTLASPPSSAPLSNRESTTVPPSGNGSTGGFVFQAPPGSKGVAKSQPPESNPQKGWTRRRRIDRGMLPEHLRDHWKIIKR